MIHQRLFVNITGVTLILQHLSDFLSKSSCLLSWNATGKVIFNFLLVSVRVLSPGADAIPLDTVAILWHQVNSSLEYLYRTLYGALSSEAQPLTCIMSAVMIIAINAYYRAHFYGCFFLRFTSIIEGFPTKTLHTPLLSLVRASFPAQLILPYLSPERNFVNITDRTF